jgi:hypothetical protein
MGTETYPKNGRARQSFGTAKSKVLKTSAGMGSATAPSSQDVCTQSKGAAWNLSKNKTKAC